MIAYYIRGSAFGLAMIAGLGAAMMPLQLAGQDLPAGRQVVDRFVEAIGGRDRITDMPAHRSTMRFEVPAQGFAGDIVGYAAPPNLLLVTIEFAGLGTVRTGYNGQVGWTINPMMGPMVMEGKELEQIREQARFDTWLYPPDMVQSLETVERTTFEQRPAYRVKVVTVSDEEYHDYFDAETGLLIGRSRTSSTPMGDIEGITVYSEYRDFGMGVLMPARQLQRAMGMEQIITLSGMHVEAIPDSIFALPPEIQGLINP